MEGESDFFLHFWCSNNSNIYNEKLSANPELTKSEKKSNATGVRSCKFHFLVWLKTPNDIKSKL